MVFLYPGLSRLNFPIYNWLCLTRNHEGFVIVQRTAHTHMEVFLFLYSKDAYTERQDELAFSPVSPTICLLVCYYIYTPARRLTVKGLFLFLPGQYTSKMSQTIFTVVPRPLALYRLYRTVGGHL